MVTAPEVRLVLWLVTQVSAAAQRLLAPLDAVAQKVMPSLPRNAAFAKLELVAAVPVVATMLLVCNSFDVGVVYNPTLPFTLP